MKSANRDWAKKYIEHMIQEDFKSGLFLRDQYLPTSVFKYRRLNKWTIDGLKNKQLYMAQIGSLNDPFECSLQFDNDACLRLYFASKLFQDGIKNKFGLELTAHELDRVIRSERPYVTYTALCKTKGIQLNMSAEEQISAVQRRWSKILDDIKKDVRVSCFSEKNDSLLMWSHYADEHKGICIEYDFQNTHVGTFLSPVAYSNEIYKIKTFEDLNPLQQIGASLTKCKDWEYELEWRYTPIKPADKPLPERVDVPVPIAVYLGTRFEKNEPVFKTELLKLLEEQKVKVYPMKLHPSEYKLIRHK
jgi:hypothetical protein